MVEVELLLFEGFDLLDVGGPYEVLLTANRLVERDGGEAVFDVRTVGVGGVPVTAYGGLVAIPHAALDPARPVDVFLVPGTVDLAAARADTLLMEAIRARAGHAALVASVCTGSVLLGYAGAIDTRTATSHPEDLDELARHLAGGRAVQARWVDDGTLVTAGGLSNGIAGALHLVERLHTRELALRTAAQIGYDFDPDDGVRTVAGSPG